MYGEFTIAPGGLLLHLRPSNLISKPYPSTLSLQFPYFQKLKIYGNYLILDCVSSHSKTVFDAWVDFLKRPSLLFSGSLGRPAPSRSVFWGFTLPKSRFQKKKNSELDL